MKKFTTILSNSALIVNRTNTWPLAQVPHLCLGMHLARLEIKSFFEQLLPRLETIELAGEASYLQANLVSGPTSLPVKYRFKAS